MLLIQYRYEHLDGQAKGMQDAKAKNPDQTFEEALVARVNSLGGVDGLGWIYLRDIKDVWEEYLAPEKTA
jgi:salicylate hydroxylase